MSSYDFLGPYTPDEGVFDDEGLGPYGMPGADPDEDFSDASGPVAGPNYLLGSGLSIDDGSQDYLGDDVPFGSGVYLGSDYDTEGLHDFEFDDDEDDDDWFMGDLFGRTSNIPSTLKGGSDVRQYLHYLVESAKNKLIQAGYPGMSLALDAPKLHGKIDSIDPTGANWTEAGGVKITQSFRPHFLKAMVDAGMSHEWRTSYLNTMGAAVSSQVPKSAPRIPQKQVSAASSHPEAVVTTVLSPEKASGKTQTVDPSSGRRTGVKGPKPKRSTKTTTTTTTSPTGLETITTTIEPRFDFPGGGAGMALGLAGVALIGIGLWSR